MESNRALQRMLGLAGDELSRRALAEITHAENRAGDERLFRELRSGERDAFEMETRFLRGDGSALWAYVTVSRMEPDDGPLALAMVEDITERRVAEEALV